jgi:hypothetical protein
MKLRRRPDKKPTGYVGDHADKLSRILSSPTTRMNGRAARTGSTDRPSSRGRSWRCPVSSGAARSGRAARPLTAGCAAPSLSPAGLPGRTGRTKRRNRCGHHRVSLTSVEAWKRHACRVAGRELTRREWEEALPDQPYRAVCGDG